MNVLVACEESQVVTIAFRKLGFRDLSVCSSSKKMRSKTFPGIANAFAHQFSAAILSGNSFSLPYQTFLKDVIL